MKSRLSLTGLLFSVLYAAFTLVLLLEVFNVLLLPLISLKLGFFSLGLLLVIFAAALSPAIIERITLSMFVPVLAATVIYSLVQFGVMWILWDVGYFLLLEIAFAFIYLAVVIPLVKVGIKMADQDRK